MLTFKKLSKNKKETTDRRLGYGATAHRLGAGLGVSGVLPGMLLNGTTRALSGGFVSGIEASMNGGDFGSGFRNGALSGGVMGAITGAIAGGVDAYSNGRNVWYGTRQGMGRSQWSVHWGDKIEEGGPEGYEFRLKEVTCHGKRAQGGGGTWNNSKIALDIGGGIYGALETAVRPGNQWAGKNGKYYNNSWGGNQYTGSRSGAFKAASTYKWAGRATLGASALIGVAETYNGYQMDGGQFGYNAQSAAFGTTGSLIGGWAGAEAGASVGAAIGVWFGGVGAVPGAIIGGFIGGFGGGYLGGNVGGGAVNYYHGR